MSIKNLVSHRELKSLRYLFYFSYIGTKYNGVQRQMKRDEKLDDNTIQGAIEAAIVFKLNPLYGARLGTGSRTDAGVHATINMAHADLTHPDPNLFYHPFQITAAVNHYLRSNNHQIILHLTRLVPKSFHSRREAKMRGYKYRLAIVNDNASLSHCNDIKNLESLLPISELYRCHIISSPDLNKMREVMELLRGEHDFASFMSSDKRFKSTIKTIEMFEFEPCDYNVINENFDSKFTMWQFNIVAKTFLYNQVRKMVGSIIAVGLGNNSIDDIKFMLNNPAVFNWNKHIPMAPAYGLWLNRFEYDENDFSMKDEESDLNDICADDDYDETHDEI